MALPDDELTAKVKAALEEGLAHPHQQYLIAIEGELDLEELAGFIVSHVRQTHQSMLSREEVVKQKLSELG